MQNRNQIFLSLVLAQILFNGCGSGGSGSSSTSSTPTERSTKNIDYWGEWKNIDKNELIYITTQTAENIEKITDNLLKIGNSYFIRNGERNVSFSGSIIDDGSGDIVNRNLSTVEDFAQTLVKLRNKRDDNIKVSTTVVAIVNTNSGVTTGKFKDNSLPSGDYILTAINGNKKLEANITIETNNQDVGTFKLVPAGIANFQTSFQSQTEFFYGNGTVYSGEIVVKNIGEDVGNGLTYEFSLDGAKSFIQDNVRGSVNVGDEVRIPVTFSFNSQLENEQIYKFNIKIIDSVGRVWNDSNSITVYKNSFNFSLVSEKNLNGVFKYPNGKIISIEGKELFLSLPTLSADKYYLLNLINYGSFAEEGSYGFSTVGTVLTDIFDKSPTSSGEPNDNLDEAPLIKTSDSQVTAYLHYKDVDYYKIYTEESNKTIEELNNKAPTVNLLYHKASLVNKSYEILRGSEVIFLFDGIDDEGIVKYELSSNIDGKLYSGTEKGFSTSSLSEGNHMISLVGYDKWNISDSETANLIVKNDPPVAKIKYSQNGDTVNFDFSASSDDLGIAKYELSGSISGDLYSGTDSNFSSALISSGEQDFVLTVFDKFNKSSTEKISFAVNSKNTAPVPSLNIWSSLYNDSVTTSISGSDSTDDRGIVNYLFSSDIDGNLSNGTDSKIETYLTAGSHTITLQVTDSDGISATISNSVDINVTKPVSQVASPTVSTNNTAKKFLNVEPNFTRFGNVVTDHVSGLIWEDQSTIFKGTFAEAETYCSNLELGGISDWRVPTLKELWYITDKTYAKPAINPIFQNTKNDWYWTNQKYDESSNRTVYFAEGYSIFNYNSILLYTRCVAGASSYEDISFSRDDSNNIVTDNLNGLMWQDQTLTEEMNWENAKTYCSDLSFGGYSDWRLPNLSELYSIADQRKTINPFINNNFKNKINPVFWSSTINKNNSSGAWFVSFNDGNDHWHYQTDDGRFAVCVRDTKSNSVYIQETPNNSLTEINDCDNIVDIDQRLQCIKNSSSVNYSKPPLLEYL